VLNAVTGRSMRRFVLIAAGDVVANVNVVVINDAFTRRLIHAVPRVVLSFSRR